MARLALKIPPPVVMGAFAFLMALLSKWSSAQWTIGALSIIVILLFAIAGLGLMVSAVVTMHQHRTTLNPLNPMQTAKLVTTGVFGLSRHPIYLGMALLLVAWCCYLGAVVSFVGVIGFMAYIQHWQIIPEERVMMDKFTEEYAQYKSRVRRWI